MRIFTEKGELINVDTSTMDTPTRARLDAVRAAYQANKEAVAALDTAYAEVANAQQAIENTESYYNARWPRQTFHDLWRETFGTPKERARVS